MGRRNNLVEGVSGTGKTSVATALELRGHHVVHGDRVLAYQGDPHTGEPLPGFSHEHHVWDVARVREVVADHTRPVTFFCGGSRNFAAFIDLFDEVFVLEVDRDTLLERLSERGPDEFGGNDDEQCGARHAEAGEVELSLQRLGGSVVVEVRDDGRGFAGLGEGSGLMGMRERAALVRAELSVISQPRHGTTVRLKVPVEAGQEGAT
jgi:hypothetical protein